MTPPPTMKAPAAAGPDLPDLATCEQEPIRTPGSIQPHGVLLAVDPRSLRVTHASANAGPRLGGPARRVLGRPLAEVLEPAVDDLVASAADTLPGGDTPRYLRTIAPPAGPPDVRYHVLAHQSSGAVVVELEESADDGTSSFDALYPLVQSLVGKLASAGSQAEACRMAAREVRALTGFDRVLVYRFDEQWNGTVVAEDGNGRLPSYLDLRFPASDIPAQARDLYRLNRIRLIPDAGYDPVPILSDRELKAGEPTAREPSGSAAGFSTGCSTGSSVERSSVPNGRGPAAEPLGSRGAREPDSKAREPGAPRPLDLTFAGLRSVSPVHLEYMRNMGTAASMSVSILAGDELWGLISCHHAEPRRVPFHARTACTFVGQVLSHQLVAQGHAADYAERIHLKTIQGRLLARMAGAADFEQGLAEDPGDLLGLTRAAGAAVVSAGGPCRLVGDTPAEADVRALVDWLQASVHEEVFATDRLAERFGPARRYAGVTSGLLAISVSKLHARYVLWFRPEVVRTVAWGGDPREAKRVDPHTGRIHPRHSFEAWKETVREQATAWRPSEVDAAAELRNNVVGIVLRQAEELAELTGELERSNKELEAFSYSVSHDLRAPFRHIVGYAELLREMESAALTSEGRRYVDTIIESAQYAGTLVDNLLTFSQMGRSSLSHVDIDMNRLVAEAIRDLAADMKGRDVHIDVKPLPTVYADLMMLRLVVQNLLSNAVKYTRPRPRAEVEVGCESDDREHVFHVRDNGVGFDMRYVDKLFGVFQRLHRMEEFEGTGIGLANVRRIVARHGGRAWAEGATDRGATFYFTLPRGRA